MTWLEEHYKITPEESVALLEQMRQENLIVNSKDPTYDTPSPTWGLS